MTGHNQDADPLRRIPTRHAGTAAADVGSIFLQARAKKGHSVEVVSQQTRISKKFIEALENNRFEEFPALAYLRGFFKCYCEYLDIEFEPLWEKAFPPEATSQTPEVPPLEPAKGHSADRSGPSLSGPALAVLAAAAALALLLFFWVRRTDRAKPPADRQPQTPAALQPIYSPPEPHLAIDFKGESWLRLQIDGETRFEGRVPKGTRQDWKAKKNIVIRASDPTLLSLTLNGTYYSLPAPDAAGDYTIESP